jgi:23S rRNA (guanosine2251-2'-O)-methyltransferase
MNFICGINPVLEALNAATRHFDRLLVVKGLRNKRIADAISRASRLGVPLRFEGRDTLDRMSGGVPHQGIIAVVSEKPLLEVEELLGRLRDPALLVALDGVEDPRNLGAILRTCEAAGADGVLLPQRRTAGLSEVVNRASAGALEHVRVARIGNLSQALEALKARGVWVVGFDASGRERWDQVDYKRPVALVMGGEGRGIRRLVRERCDHVVSLPMFGHVGSLNVSVAAGIALYEVVRQRGSVPSHVRPIPAGASSQAAPRVLGPRPDDDEADPGDLRPALQHDAFDETPERGEDDGDQVPHTVVQIHDEEVAWAGPEVLRSKRGVRARSPQRQERGRKRKRDRRPGPRPAPGPREVPPADAPARDVAAPGPGAGEKRGRRRKKRRGPRDEAARPLTGERAAGPEPPVASSSEPTGSAAAGADGPEGAAARRGRRRRRRRRH